MSDAKKIAVNGTEVNSNDETELIWVSGPISRVEIAEGQVISG